MPETSSHGSRPGPRTKGNDQALGWRDVTVFGLGNRDWAATHHRIPKLVDDLMEKLGATRFFPAGYVDVSQDIAGPFEDWKAGLFPKLREIAGVTACVQAAQSASMSRTRRR